MFALLVVGILVAAFIWAVCSAKPRAANDSQYHPLTKEARAQQRYNADQWVERNLASQHREAVKKSAKHQRRKPTVPARPMAMIGPPIGDTSGQVNEVANATIPEPQVVVVSPKTEPSLN